MKIAIGSDERTYLTDFVIRQLKKRGHEVKLHGALIREKVQWPEVGEEVAEAVASGECQEGILFCWTGTGVSIVANKVPGIRAALCYDAQTAIGARKWNHANVLVMSLRATSEAIANEILDAWFNTPFSSEQQDVENVTKISEIYGKHAQHWVSLRK